MIAMLIQCSLVQPAEQEQGSKMMTIKQASELYLESMQEEFYLTGIKELFDKCNICIGVMGDYVEK